MRFEFTVAAPNGPRDVAITAADAAPPNALRRAVVDAARLCGLALPPDRAGLPRTGAVVAAADTSSPAEAGMSLVVVAGRCAGTVQTLRPGRFSIGRAPECDLVLGDASVSRQHAELEVGRRRVTVRDLASTNGCRIDGIPVKAATELRPGQVLQLGNSAVGVRQAVDEPRAALLERGDVVLVHRPPRPPQPPAAEPIDLPTDPPASPIPHRMAIAGALVPAALGGFIAWFTGSLQFLLFAALTPAMLLSTAFGERLHWRRLRRRAGKQHRRAVQAAERAIAAALDAERDQLRASAPHPAEVERIVTTPAPRLWERGADDADFLMLRLGTASLPSRVLTRCGGDEKSAGTIPAAPVCVDLRAGPLAVCGPPEVTRAVGRWLLIQAAALHSPALLRISLDLPTEDAPWHWARWLPHLSDAAGPDTRTLLLVDAPTAAGHRPTLDSPHVVYLTRDRETVPTSCVHILTVQDARTGGAVLSRQAAEQQELELVLDQVDEAWSERVARALAPLSAGSGPRGAAGPSPPLCELLELGVPDGTCIAAHWQRAGGAPRAVLGIGDDGPVWIDLAADGPHCLVAGTTGAGKSELLRTLVTGLALRHPPTAVSFLLIDYKGGAAFAACADLPHVVGLVTDLDAQLTRRALRALHAELQRRERVLAAAGTVDIDGLHRARPELALPRLVVVVDEFAALSDELPDFVPGLISVAQRGRSLGLHLVLATQRPGRAVTPEIKANTSLRIAFRVTDTTESLDVIDSPLAASLPAHSPGAGVIRIGDRRSAFRAARAGAPPAGPDVRVELLDRWRQPLPAAVTAEPEDGLQAVVAAVETAAELCNAGRPPRPWLPPLPAQVFADLGADGAAEVDLALVDLPAEQRQDILRIDLAAPRPLLICGTTGSGRTGALLGLALRAARQLSPEQLEIYVVEQGGELRSMLGPLPQLAAAVSGAADDGLVLTLLRRLTAGPPNASTDTAAPLRLLLVDDWDAILASADDRAGAQLSDVFAGLIRTAVEHGLTVVVTGDRTLLSARWSFAVDTRLLLRLADRADYALAGVPLRDVPTAMPPGRGLRAGDGAELQLFIPPAASERPLAEAIAIRHRWPNTSRTRAVRIRPLPERVHLDRCDLPPIGIRLGVGGDGAVTIVVDPLTSGHLVVAGPPRSGRSSALRTVLAECLRTGVAVIAAAPHRSPLHAHATQLGVPVIGCAAPGDAVAEPPPTPTVLLVDDCEAFDDTPVGDRLAHWLRSQHPLLGAVVAGRTDELASAYRGIGAEARRNRSGVLLRPRPLDGELFGVRLDRAGSVYAPGRGVLVGVRCWIAPEPDAPGWTPLDARNPVPIQIALPGASVEQPDQPPAMWGYR